MSIFGKCFKVFTYGQSHSKITGCVIEGFPSNFHLDLNKIQKELNRRKPGQSDISTPRRQDDLLECMTGMDKGVTLGSPLCFQVKNQNVKEQDYDQFAFVPRPGHADFTYLKKYGVKATSGGGRSSARETVGRVIAGAVAKQYLDTLGITFAAWVQNVGGIAIPSNINHRLTSDKISNHLIDELGTITQGKDKNTYFYKRDNMLFSYDLMLDTQSEVTKEGMGQRISNVRCPHQPTAIKIYNSIKQIQKQQDSLGGVVQGCIYGLPHGLGEPVFDKIQAQMAHAMLSIPATKGFQFGSGFACSNMKGSEHNDLFNTDLSLQTNNSGGSLGGITTAQTFSYKVAFKPVSTIGKVQKTSTLSGQLMELESRGRHDPCVLPRAPPIVDNMAAIVIMDLLMRNKQHNFAANIN